MSSDCWYLDKLVVIPTLFACGIYSLLIGLKVIIWWYCNNIVSIILMPFAILSSLQALYYTWEQGQNFRESSCSFSMDDDDSIFVTPLLDDDVLTVRSRLRTRLIAVDPLESRICQCHMSGVDQDDNDALNEMALGVGLSVLAFLLSLIDVSIHCQPQRSSASSSRAEMDTAAEEREKEEATDETIKRHIAAIPNKKPLQRRETTGTEETTGTTEDPFEEDPDVLVDIALSEF